MPDSAPTFRRVIVIRTGTALRTPSASCPAVPDQVPTTDGACARVPASRRGGGAAGSYQCTPFMRFAMAICSMDAFSSGFFLPDAAAESGNTL